MFDREKLRPAIAQIVEEAKAGCQYPLSNSVRHVKSELSGTGKTLSEDGLVYLPETTQRSRVLDRPWKGLDLFTFLRWTYYMTHELMKQKESELEHLEGERVWVENWPIYFDWARINEKCSCQLTMRGAATTAIKPATREQT